MDISNKTLSILNSSNVSSVVVAGAPWMREMYPGVSFPPTMDTQCNQWSSQALMVNPNFHLSLHSFHTHVYLMVHTFGFWFSLFYDSNCSTFPRSDYLCFPPFHLLCPRRDFLWNKTWMAYQKTWLTFSMHVFLFSAWSLCLMWTQSFKKK